MAAIPKEASATQKFIEIKSVQNGVVILKNGSLRQILMVSGLNFDLKSEEEQNAITQAYQSFLNSLNFSLQIFIHSRRLNIDQYLGNILNLELKEQNPLLRGQLAEYREFIHAFVSGNTIMNKTFFVVVPFDPIQLPEVGKAVTKRFFGLLSKAPPQTTQESEDNQHLKEYINQLTQRTDQVIAGLNQIGLRAVPLNDAETTELFYNLYNPGINEKQGILTAKK